MTKEVWKVIKDFPNYQVSNYGMIRNGKTGNILKPLLNKDDYYYVDLYNEPRKPVHKRIHRLVADAFLGPHPNLVVNHIDGDKHNNNLSNIEWVTPEENSRLASETGLYKTKPVKIIETGDIFRSVRECADYLNVHPSDINHVITGQRKSIRGFHFEYINECDKPFLRDYQMDAVKQMKNGCILNGGVGSGKSRTGLYYYFSRYGGNMENGYKRMIEPVDLFIITTAKKRDSLEWSKELIPFLLTTDADVNYKRHRNKVIVDSWNNIKKYADVKNSFFIFDEDRITGRGEWVKAFLKIAKSNEWIILSATPGDTYQDYVPVFIANGFYKNRTEFSREHIIYSRFTKYPKIDRYVNTRKLERLRDRILVDMDFERHTVSHHEDVVVEYDIKKYKEVTRTRWDPFKNEPIPSASALCYVWRKIVNTDVSRQVKILELFEKHPRMIIFYNFDYELDILKNLYYGPDVEIAEWNGHKHQPLPTCDRWIYLVQYTAGCEGWNCITTDTIVFYSQNYSYKVMEQASGRINRLNTPYTDLYYYHLKCKASIDVAIGRALREKKKFNERKFAKW